MLTSVLLASKATQKTLGSAYWSDTPSSSRSRHSITEEQLVTHVEYLIDNIYVNIGNKVFRQCVGIPMGTDCAPLLAIF